jgi:hypothetical protein
MPYLGLLAVMFTDILSGSTFRAGRNSLLKRKKFPVLREFAECTFGAGRRPSFRHPGPPYDRIAIAVQSDSVRPPLEILFDA